MMNTNISKMLDVTKKKGPGLHNGQYALADSPHYFSVSISDYEGQQEYVGTYKGDMIGA